MNSKEFYSIWQGGTGKNTGGFNPDLLEGWIKLDDYTKPSQETLAEMNGRALSVLWPNGLSWQKTGWDIPSRLSLSALFAISA